MTIKIGDFVRFRAGGPMMEVVELADDGARCAWCVGIERQIAWVSFAVLVRVWRDLPLKANNPIQVLN